ncbi:MAG TPA: hypothetical protein VNG29_00350 [Candidatus Paceibacterota bacterium]|nr:hypothetical protein [Candidatus Paceibacterota bacterium]
MKKKSKRRRAIIEARFATAADVARILGVSPKRLKELQKLAGSASKSGKKKRR